MKLFAFTFKFIQFEWFFGCLLEIEHQGSGCRLIDWLKTGKGQISPTKENFGPSDFYSTIKY